MSEFITILGSEMPMNEARNLWFALREVFEVHTIDGFWSMIPDEHKGETIALFCPCNDCLLFKDAA